MKKKYRKRIRKEEYDYSQDNLYFVTICVQNRTCCLGSIPRNGAQNENNNRSAPDSYSSNSVDYQEEVKKGEEEIQIKLNDYGEIAQKQMLWLEEQYPYVIIHNFVIMPNHVHAIIEIDSELVGENQVKIKSLSELIGAYKTTSSKYIHQKGLTEFAWQRSFHDHIIRDTVAYENIYDYINTNPARWNSDTFFDTP